VHSVFHPAHREQAFRTYSNWKKFHEKDDWLNDASPDLFMLLIDPLSLHQAVVAWRVFTSLKARPMTRSMTRLLAHELITWMRKLRLYNTEAYDFMPIV
jgi:hypothetical protein